MQNQLSMLVDVIDTEDIELNLEYEYLVINSNVDLADNVNLKKEFKNIQELDNIFTY